MPLMIMIMHGMYSNRHIVLLLYAAAILCPLPVSTLEWTKNPFIQNIARIFDKSTVVFVPNEPLEPQQVHLSLTDKPGEMNITWVTFHDAQYPDGVSTVVRFWDVKNADEHRTLKATRKRHEYNDKIQIGKDKDDKPIFKKIGNNIRYIHTVTLINLEDNQRYGYKVGYCVPAKAKWFNGKEDCVCVPENGENACEVRYRDQEFNFKMFPWNRSGVDIAPFTIAVFGDLGLWKVPPKKPEETLLENLKLDPLAPQNSLDALIALVHGPQHSLEGPLKKYKTKEGKEHPIRKSHLDEKSSGLDMNNVQLILHIGDIAYDMHEWRFETEVTKRGTKKKVYNVGDRFMSVIEHVAAYVPYMVVAGNHENEENTEARPETPGPGVHYDPQYEHYESRYNMPRNFAGHDTSQFYHFVYGPIWFISVSTEFYYSFKTGSKETTTFHPDYKRVKQQYDFIEYSLKEANLRRDKHPWVVVVQHRPFHCTSTNKFTCQKNKLHKNGIPDPFDKNKHIYGLEELYNKYHVDLVITGHEHTYEMFPPIQQHNDKNRVIPYKYWWHASATSPAANAQDGETGLTTAAADEVKHQFMAYTDPIAPTYVIVGRPGNDEAVEILVNFAQLQRVERYDKFSITLLHYPGERANKSLISVRQVDIESGHVPLEFALEKTFAIYDEQLICNAIESEDLMHKKRSIYWLDSGDIIKNKTPFRADEEFWRKSMPENPAEFSIFYEVESNEPSTQSLDKHEKVDVEKLKIDIAKLPTIPPIPSNPDESTMKLMSKLNSRTRSVAGKGKRNGLATPLSRHHSTIPSSNSRRKKLISVSGTIISAERKSQRTKKPERVKSITFGARKKIEGRPKKPLTDQEKKMALFEQEIGTKACVNSKLRALLHTFHMQRSPPNNEDWISLYKTAKSKVCNKTETLTGEEAERGRVQSKFIDDRYRQLEHIFISIDHGKKNAKQQAIARKIKGKQLTDLYDKDKEFYELIVVPLVDKCADSSFVKKYKDRLTKEPEQKLHQHPNDAVKKLCETVKGFGKLLSELSAANEERAKMGREDPKKMAEISQKIHELARQDSWHHSQKDCRTFLTKEEANKITDEVSKIAKTQAALDTAFREEHRQLFGLKIRENHGEQMKLEEILPSTYRMLLICDKMSSVFNRNAEEQRHLAYQHFVANLAFYALRLMDPAKSADGQKGEIQRMAEAWRIGMIGNLTGLDKQFHELVVLPMEWECFDRRHTDDAYSGMDEMGKLCTNVANLNELLTGWDDNEQLQQRTTTTADGWTLRKMELTVDHVRQRIRQYIHLDATDLMTNSSHYLMQHANDAGDVIQKAVDKIVTDTVETKGGNLAAALKAELMKTYVKFKRTYAEYKEAKAKNISSDGGEAQEQRVECQKAAHKLLCILTKLEEVSPSAAEGKQTMASYRQFAINLHIHSLHINVPTTVANGKRRKSQIQTIADYWLLFPHLSNRQQEFYIQIMVPLVHKCSGPQNKILIDSFKALLFWKGIKKGIKRKDNFCGTVTQLNALFTSLNEEKDVRPAAGQKDTLKMKFVAIYDFVSSQNSKNSLFDCRHWLKQDLEDKTMREIESFGTKPGERANANAAFIQTFGQLVKQLGNGENAGKNVAIERRKVAYKLVIIGDLLRGSEFNGSHSLSVEQKVEWAMQQFAANLAVCSLYLPKDTSEFIQMIVEKWPIGMKN